MRVRGWVCLREGQRVGVPREGERVSMLREDERVSVLREGERVGVPREGERVGMPACMRVKWLLVLYGEGEFVVQFYRYLKIECCTISLSAAHISIIFILCIIFL